MVANHVSRFVPRGEELFAFIAVDVAAEQDNRVRRAVAHDAAFQIGESLAGDADAEKVRHWRRW